MSASLVDARGLLEALWPDGQSRPSARWLRQQRRNRAIPFIRLGHLIYFDVDQVRAAIEERHTVQPRKV